MDPRKEELERKKKRLEELRKTRDERQSELDKLKKQTKNTEEKFRERRQEVDSLVNEILSGSPTKTSAESITPLTTTTTAAVSSLPHQPLTSNLPNGPENVETVQKQNSCSEPARPTPKLEFVDVLLMDLPPKERITYTKEVQTDPLSPSTSPLSEDASQDSTMSAPKDVSSPVHSLPNEDALSEEALPVFKKLSDEEKKSILTSEPFLHFFNPSAHIMEKALSVAEKFDFLKDYSTSLHATRQTNDMSSAKLINTFFSEKYTEGRTVISIEWNPQFPELFFVAYSKSRRPTAQMDGLVLAWNLFLPGTPEFVLTCQSEITTALFSPFQPNILAAGTYSGQIVVWDTKTKLSKPKLKTALSHSGHTHPITCAAMIGTTTLHHLITSSTEGCVCAWPLDMLSHPTETLQLKGPSLELGVTCFAFAMNETTQFYVGTDDGWVMHVQRLDRPGVPSGVLTSWEAHESCITHLDFHPLHTTGPYDFSDLLLTCSLDWTVKLWRLSKLLFQFDVNHDYVLDARWSPTHAAVFATCNSGGFLDIYNLNLDPEMYSCRIKVPASTHNETGLNKLCFDKEGKKVAVGSSDGKVYLYELDDRFLPHEGDRALFQKTLAQFESMNEKQKVDPEI